MSTVKVAPRDLNKIVEMRKAGQSYRQIGQRLDVSYERIRQIAVKLGCTEKGVFGEIEVVHADAESIVSVNINTLRVYTLRPAVRGRESLGFVAIAQKMYDCIVVTWQECQKMREEMDHLRLAAYKYEAYQLHINEVEAEMEKTDKIIAALEAMEDIEAV